MKKNGEKQIVFFLLKTIHIFDAAGEAAAAIEGLSTRFFLSMFEHVCMRAIHLTGRALAHTKNGYNFYKNPLIE